MQGIHLSLSSNEKMAITGDNGSGKTSLLKAILDDATVIKTGEWVLPKQDDIGYLDQHYTNVSSDKSVLQLLSECVPEWHATEVRRHLSDFLFRGNDSVNTLACHLSGGEKARLSLALIAAKPPKLLILDEITNNLDLETLEHVTQILKSYPAAMMVISHDKNFLADIDIDTTIELSNGRVLEVT